MATEFHAGDILFFRGRGPLSTAIALGTCLPSQWLCGCAPSHVAIVADYRGTAKLFESTTLCDLPCEILGHPVKGVQCHDPQRRIDAYDGHVWVMRLSADWAPLLKAQSDRLTKFCTDHIGDSYDFDGLGRTWLWEHVVTFLRPPKRHTVCSRFVSKAVMHTGLISLSIVPDGISPGYMARQWPRCEVYDVPELVKGQARRVA